MTDLRDHLFAQIERLSDEEMSPEDLKLEIERAHAMSSMATVVVNTAKVEVAYLKQIDRMNGVTNDTGFIVPQLPEGNGKH